MAGPSSNAAGQPGHVVVLMSTYNGERYVAEQLRSILAQLPMQGSLLVRDDGSLDGTVAAIEALRDPRIHLSQGQNCGFGRSFLTLLSQVPVSAEMVMFSDQDDVWLPDKVERAWLRLQGLNNQPALYGSAQMLVDAALRPLGPTPPWTRGPSFASAWTENIITGCTAAINRPAVELLQRAGVPEGVHFHDWWLYVVISAFGIVVYDEQPSLLYRQHGGNVIGRGAGRLGRPWAVLRFLRRNDWIGILLRQIRAFLDHYGGMLPTQTRNLLLKYFRIMPNGAAPRWRLVFSLRRWRQASVAEDLALRLLVVLYKLRLWPPR